MPCNDPTPTDREVRASKALSIIKLIKEAGGNIKYPEGFSGDTSAYFEFGSDKYLDESTDILCSFCRTMGDDFIYNGRFQERRKLADWWDEHKEIDRDAGRI